MIYLFTTIYLLFHLVFIDLLVIAVAIKYTNTQKKLKEKWGNDYVSNN